MRNRLLGMVFIVLIVANVIAACANNPVATAKTPEQKAFAVYGEFVVFEEAGAKIASDPSTTASVLTALKTADARAKPVMDSTLAAALEVVSVEKQIAAGSTTADKLVIATANLQSWVDQGTPLVNNLVSAVKGASSGP